MLVRCYLCDYTHLIGELSQPRKSEQIRLPELSQPLVTALQILQVTVLQSWGIRAQSVVGHSSGEIAAAYTAGYITAEDAIRIAYYRGQAVAYIKKDGAPKLGMLAVGLGYDECHPYIHGKEDGVQVGCFNSPNSITLSGRLDDLNDVKADLEQNGHFARLLQLDIAYHSSFIADVGSYYEGLVAKHCKIPKSSHGGDVTMFSSLTGTRLNGPCNSTYWRDNMVSPVQFERATRAMILSPGGIDFVFELGPSDSLSGPMAQIKKYMTESGVDFTYASASKRGPSAIEALFDVAGKLYLAGHNVLMAEVNKDHESLKEPNVIVDLPNYSWNHSIKYWHEGQASRDWRFGRFRHHDLLGSKLLGTSWRAPSWRNLLKIENLPWLKDHKVRVMQAYIDYVQHLIDYGGQMGHEIVYPAACYMSMAVESIYQAYTHAATSDGQVTQFSYRLRNVKFERALVLQSGANNYELLTVLTPCQESGEGWHEFRILSQADGDWSAHCRGLVRINQQAGQRIYRTRERERMKLT